MKTATGLVAILALAWGAWAHGDGTPEATPGDDVERVAQAVREAHRAKDGERLNSLAAGREPDPWLVADRLTALAEGEAAAGYVRLVPGPAAGDALRAYLVSAPAVAESVRASIERAALAVASGDFDGAATELGVAPPPAATVADVRWHLLRAEVLEGRSEAAAAVDAFLDAGARAESIGWAAVEARALHRAGLLRHRAGDVVEARKLFDRVFAVAERVGDAEVAARTRANLGSLAFAEGDYPRALRHYRAALPVLEQRGLRGEMALALVHVATVLTTMGDYDGAEDALARAFRAFEGMDAVPSQDVADARIARGNLLAAVGDPAGAAEEYRRAQEVSAKAQDPMGEGYALGNLAILWAEEGELAKALDALDRTRALLESGAQGDSAPLRQVDANRAEVLLRLRRIPEAVVLATATREAAVASHDENLAARTEDTLADATLLQGKAAAAIEAYGALLDVAERLQSDDLRLEAWSGQARARLASGDAKDAARAARQAVRVLESMTRGLPMGEGAGLRERRAEVFEVGALASLALGDATGLGYFLECGRCGELLDALGGREAAESLALSPAATVKLAAARSRAQDTLERLVAEAAEEGARSPERRAARRKEHDDALREIEEAERAFDTESRAIALRDVLRARVESVEDLQGTLAPDEAFVSYGTFAEKVCALVVTRAAARAVDLGSRPELDALVDAARVKSRTSSAGEALAALRARAVDPLRLPAGLTRMVVSPDGTLCDVPFVLLFPEGTRVSYLPSGTTGRMLAEQSARKGEAVLALGNPDYAVPRPAPLVTSLRAASARLSALPASDAEAKAVGDVILLGRAATEQGLRKSLATSPRWRAVHVACHGVIDAERPLCSALVLTPGAGDDGYLTGYDLRQMQIPADLVVLSACDTARGRLVAGEGIIGFSRLVMYAGAPRVVVSLWKADDEATAVLMTELHRLWKKGVPAAVALLGAQAKVRDARPAWKHPFYWAAWQVWGLAD